MDKVAGWFVYYTLDSNKFWRRNHYFAILGNVWLISLKKHFCPVMLYIFLTLYIYIYYVSNISLRN